MDEIIAILRELLTTLAALTEATDALRTVLKAPPDGRAVSAATTAVDAHLKKLSAVMEKRTALLVRLGAESLQDALQKAASAPEKIRAKQYLDRVHECIRHLQKTSGTNHALLKKDMTYLQFTLNVMTRAQAGPGYEPGDGGTTQGRKLFDSAV